MEISFTSWVLIILSLLCIIPLVFTFSKGFFGIYFNPLTVYAVPWIAVGILYSLFSRFLPEYSVQGILVQALGHLGYSLGCVSIVIIPNYNICNKNYVWHLSELTLYKILWMALVLRVFWIAFSIHEMLKIAGSLSVYLNCSTYVRIKYLSRPDISQSFLEAFIRNFLSLPLGLGLVIAAIYLSVTKRKTVLPYVYIALSPLHNLILFSKWPATVELIFFLWALFLCLEHLDFVSYRQFDEKIKKMSHREKIKKKGISLKMLLFAGILFICLLVLVSTQRNYVEQESPLPGLSTPVAKTFAYIIYPSVGLDLLVKKNQGCEFAGALTFRPLVKWLISFGFLSRSYLPPRFEDSIRSYDNREFGNVYTWLGYFYRDFGLVGVFFMPYIMGLLTSFAFFRARNHVTLFNLSLSAILGAAISLSSFAFLFHQTYYLLLPIYCGCIDYLLKSRSYKLGSNTFSQEKPTF